MRYQCTIQQPVITQDAAGQPIVSWTAYVVNEPCEYSPTGGIESMRGRQVESGTRAVFTVRYLNQQLQDLMTVPAHLAEVH